MTNENVETVDVVEATEAVEIVNVAETPAPKKRRKHNAFLRNPFAVFVFVLLIIYTFSFLGPTLWMIISSFKSAENFRVSTQTLGGMLSFPKAWRFDNYAEGFKLLTVKVVVPGVGDVPYNFWWLTLNSFIYSFGSTFIHTCTCCCAAYAAAKYGKYLICRMLYPIVIVTMILPIVGALGAELKLMRDIGFYDNLFGLLMMKTGFLGQYFLIFYAAFKSLSDGYAEAARVDGAGHLRIFVSIIMPLMATTFAAIFLVTFITNWNAWNVNVIYMPSFPMISYSLYLIQNGHLNKATAPIKMAATIIVSVPILIVFILLRKKLMGSLTMGGLKG